MAGRREWNARYGSYIKQTRTWQVIAFLSLMISLVSVVFLGISSSQNKYIPYIIEVDKLGTAVAVAPAQPITKQDERVIKHSLAEFVSNMFTVYGDRVVQKDNIFKAYRYLLPASNAYTSVSEYYKQNSPFVKMETERNTIEILSVIQISKDTWQIDWQESKSDIKGNPISREYFKGAATLKYIEPKDEKEIFKNPTGLWIYEFSWQKILK